MKVVVLGAGVVGVTSAWYLSQEGHEVVVIDRQSDCALETSHANAGQISYGYSSPWAAPGIPFKAMKWMTQTHAPLKITPTPSPEQYSWMMSMLRNCTTERYEVNKGRMLRVANYSRECLAKLRENVDDLNFEGRSKGTLQLFRTDAQVEAAQKDAKVLEAFNTPFQLLSREECIQYEPALAKVKDKITGGMRMPNDETGDCFKFTRALAKKAEEHGVEFHYNTTIANLLVANGEVKGVATDKGEFIADAVVVALGSYSKSLLADVGLAAPIYPVKGYSLTVEIENPDGAPESTVMDETNKVAITRFDNRVRIAGTAELAGYTLALTPKRRETIARVVRDLFPEAGNVDKAEFWTGLRPMTPDGTPIIGKTPINNLYTNTGHGTLGWTMGCGSGKLIADIVSGKQTEIEAHDLGISRYN